MSPAAGTSAVVCDVCASLSNEELRDLDLLLSDPGKWPATLWDAIGKPAKMTPNARRFGQIEMGMAWLGSRNLVDISRLAMTRHIRQHVVAVPRIEDLFAGTAPTGALQLVEFMAKALQAGNVALTKVIAQLEANPGQFTIPQLLDIAEFASKLAVSAGRKSAEPPQLPAGDSGPSGFMGPRPSVRVGHHRMRDIEGESRMVVDEGPRDRQLYNERADQEGGPRL